MRIDKEKIKGTSLQDLKVILRIPKGDIPIIELIDDAEKHKNNDLVFPTNLFYYVFSGQLVNNKNEYKIELWTPYVDYSKFVSNSNSLLRRLSDSGLTHTASKRAKILFGIALSAAIPTSTISGFYRRQKPVDRKYQLKHKEIIKSIPEFKSKDFEDKVQEALNYLWFNYPYELTGYDNSIKRLTLERIDDFTY